MTLSYSIRQILHALPVTPLKSETISILSWVTVEISSPWHWQQRKMGGKEGSRITLRHSAWIYDLWQSISQVRTSQFTFATYSHTCLQWSRLSAVITLPVMIALVCNYHHCLQWSHLSAVFTPVVMITLANNHICLQWSHLSAVITLASSDHTLGKSHLPVVISLAAMITLASSDHT